jgi:branched-chain amino acid transport system permease protein
VLALLRIVNSPFGRVLQAIRENDFRAEAIGYRTVVYRTIASVASALFATLAGVLLALWLRYNGPDTTLSFEIMLDVLLIVVIGGMGTIYGAVVGSVLLVLAQNYLQDLMKIGAASVQDIPVLSQIVSPDRWLLWLGILFVLSVYYFPNGVVGRLRAMRRRPPATRRGAPRLRAGRDRERLHQGLERRGSIGLTRWWSKPASAVRRRPPPDPSPTGPPAASTRSRVLPGSAG